MLAPEHPALKRFKAKRCATLDEVRGWVEEERERHRQARTNTDEHGQGSGGELSVQVRGCPCESISSAGLVANAALPLLNVCCHFLDRQMAAQAESFEKDGGFTERLYHHRKSRRKDD